MASKDPSYRSKTDDEIAHSLRRMADKFDPVDADEASLKWAAHAAWQRDSAHLLS